MCDVITRRPEREACRLRVENTLERFRQDLAPLVRGQMQVAERLSGEAWVDVTPGVIDSLRRTMATLEAVLTELR